jgi:hypothetical protein
VPQPFDGQRRGEAEFQARNRRPKDFYHWLDGAQGQCHPARHCSECFLVLRSLAIQLGVHRVRRLETNIVSFCYGDTKWTSQISQSRLYCLMVPLAAQYSNSAGIANPPNFVPLTSLSKGKGRAAKGKLPVNDSEGADEKLKVIRQKKAWDLALGPAKSVPIQVGLRD